MFQILFVVMQLAKFVAGAVTLLLLALALLFGLIGQWALAIVLLLLAAGAGFVTFKLAQAA